MTRRAGARSRVIVAIGSSATNPSALTAAAQLARVAHYELAALFVEDINLLRLAELPFAFEISADLARPRPLDTREVERGFKKEADALRDVLAHAGAALKLECTFDVVRGHPARVLFEAASERDLIVLPGAAAKAPTHRPSAYIVRNALHSAAAGVAAQRKQPVVAMLKAGPSAERVLAIAHELAAGEHAELVLLIAMQNDTDCTLLTAAENWLAEHGAGARIYSLDDSGYANVIDAVEATDARVLFWPGDGEIAAPLIEQIHCPLVVVR